MKKATLEDIAKAAGVGIATVDRVVNQRGGVSAKTEALVREWADKLNLDRRIFRSKLRAIRVAVVIPSHSNPFFAALRDAYKALNRTIDGVEFRIFFHFVEPSRNLEFFKSFDNFHVNYDGIIICSPEEPAIVKAVLKVSRSLPVVTLVNDLPNSGRIAYVGPDNRQLGRLAGDLMGRFMGANGGKVLIMIGDHKIVGQQEREIGFRSVLRDRHPNVRVLEVVESEEDALRAVSLAQIAIDNNEDLRGIYNVSAGNYGVAKHLVDKGRENDIIFITHELTPTRSKLLKSGVIDAVIDQNPLIEAHKSIEILARYLDKNEGEQLAEGPTPFNIYLRENCP